MPITIQKAEKEAQLTLNGIQLDKGSFARMKSLEKACLNPYFNGRRFRS